MSTLEKIRKYPALVISVVGFAIVLFIVTGVITNFEIFRDHDTAATVDGTKIKIQELRDNTKEAHDQEMAQYNQYNQRYQESGIKNPTPQPSYEAAEQNVLDQMISQTLLEKAIDNLGITVTHQELQNLLFGDNAIPYVLQLARKYGRTTPEDLYTFTLSGEPYSDAAKAEWEKMEKDLTDQLRSAKYQAQLQALTVNKLDAQSLFDQKARTINVARAQKNYMTVADADEFQPTEAEIKARYNEKKNAYAIPTEERLISYIYVDPAPSAADYAAAQQEVNDALEGLRTYEGLDAVASNYNFETKNIRGSKDAIKDQAVKGAIESLEADSAGVVLLPFSDNRYTLVKLLDTKMTPDSLFADILWVNTAGSSLETILETLNGGTAAEELGEALLQPYMDQKLYLIDSEFEAYTDQFSNAGTGKYFRLNLNNAEAMGDSIAMLVRVNRLTAPVKVYSIGKAVRDVEPSSQTFNELEEQLLTYVANHKDAKSFRDSIANSAFNVSYATVTPASLLIANYPESGAAAKWAMGAKKGQVSDVYTGNNRNLLLAVAVDEISNGNLSVNVPSVNGRITRELIAEKKGDKLMEEYAGKANDLKGYAELMGAPIDTLNVTLDQNFSEPKVLASIAAANKGELVGPIEGRNSIQVFVVLGDETAAREFDYDTDKLAFDRTAMGPSRLLNNFPQILRANKKVKYDLQRFIAGE